jgi:hypothetical protein
VTTTPVEHAGTEVARPLRVLVPLIKDELAKGHEAGIEHFRRAGAMLLEAKDQVRPGEWHRWLGRNFTLTIRTAAAHMQLARESAAHTKRATHATTYSEFRQPDRHPGHRISWHEPVERILADRVDFDRLARERQSRDKEDRLVRQLAHQVIDIGYRVLSTKLHPDKGGSQEAMSRLNRVRTQLRDAIAKF